MAMVSGLAPGSCVVTWMVGKSTCGSDETGSHQIAEQRRRSMTATPSSEVAIGAMDERRRHVHCLALAV